MKNEKTLRKVLVLFASALLVIGIVVGSVLLFTNKKPTDNFQAMTDVTVTTNDHGAKITGSGTFQNGSYYLSSDLTADLVFTGNASLCLHGHTLTGSSSAIRVDKGATLTIYDCSGAACMASGLNGEREVESYADYGVDPGFNPDDDHGDRPSSMPAPGTSVGRIIPGTGYIAKTNEYSRDVNVNSALLDEEREVSTYADYAKPPVFDTGSGSGSGGGSGSEDRYQTIYYHEYYYYGGAICVNGGAVVMRGGVIGGGDVSAYAGSLSEREVATYADYGSPPVFGDNTSTHRYTYYYHGKAVAVIEGGYFEMSRGSIVGNNGENYTGTVYVNNSTFVMNTGKIAGNNANIGGGVALYGVAVFTMNGGSITNNTATTVAGGVYLGETAKMTVSGAPAVINNKLNNAASNVYAASASNKPTVKEGSSVVRGVDVSLTESGAADKVWWRLFDVTFNVDGVTETKVAGIYDGNVKKVENPGDPSKDGYTFTGWYENGNKFELTSEVTHDMTLNARFTPIEYQISYDTDGGNNIGNTKFTCEDEITTLPTPTKTGYTFLGWYIGKTKVERINKGTMNSMTLKAQWQSNAIAVTYSGGESSTNGPVKQDSVPANTQANFNSDYTVAAAPERKGYDFQHYSASTGGTYAPGATYHMTTTPVTFTAVWTVHKYKISYDVRPGSNNPNTTVEYTVEQTVTLSDASSPEGYTFNGWSHDGKIVAGTTGDITFTASYTKIQYSITYAGVEGATNPNTRTSYTIEDSFELSAPTKPGYTFNGWTNGGKIEQGMTGNKTFTATWSAPLEYTISYVLNGGTQNSANPVKYTVESEITLKDPTKTGYRFDGWFTAATGGTKVTSFSRNTGNKTFYARWTIQSYNIEYKNGLPTTGSNSLIVESMPNPSTVTNVEYNTNQTLSTTVPTRKGYTFTGWSDGSNTYSAGASFTMPASNVTLTAQWEKVTYTITLNYKNTVGTKTLSYDVESPTTTLPTVSSDSNLKKTGYTFFAWYDNEACTGNAVTEVLSSTAAHKTVYAKWTPVEYIITYELNEGTNNASNPRTYNIDTAVTLANPTREGYNFVAWYNKSDFSGDPVTGIPVNNMGNRTFYAKWDGQPFKITFDPNGGVITDSSVSNNEKVVKCGDSYILPAIEKTGYCLKSWTLTPASVTLIGGTSVKMPAYDFTAKAEWEPIPYKVSVYTTVGGTTPDQTFNAQYYMHEIPQIAAPTAKGYTFAGWEYKSGEETINPAADGKYYMPAGNVTMRAQWTKNKWDVALDMDDGDSIDLQSKYEYDALVTLPTPTKLGHTFVKWTITSYENGSTANIVPTASGSNWTFKMPDSRVTIKANWNRNSYALIVHANLGADHVADDGFLMSDLSVKTEVTSKVPYDAVTQLPSYSSLTYAGYDFVDWYSDQEFNHKFTFGTRMGAGELHVYAKWEQKKYTFKLSYPDDLTIDVEASTSVGTQNLTAGQKSYTVYHGWTITLTVAKPGTTGITYSMEDTLGYNCADIFSATDKLDASGNFVYPYGSIGKDIVVTFKSIVTNAKGGTTTSTNSSTQDGNATIDTTTTESTTRPDIVGGETLVTITNEEKVTTDDPVEGYKMTTITTVVQQCVSDSTGNLVLVGGQKQVRSKTVTTETQIEMGDSVMKNKTVEVWTWQDGSLKLESKTNYVFQAGTWVVVS